jgi:hypothetical protein
MYSTYKKFNTIKAKKHYIYHSLQICLTLLSNIWSLRSELNSPRLLAMMIGQSTSTHSQKKYFPLISKVTTIVNCLKKILFKRVTVTILNVCPLSPDLFLN